MRGFHSHPERVASTDLQTCRHLSRQDQKVINLVSDPRGAIRREKSDNRESMNSLECHKNVLQSNRMVSYKSERRFFSAPATQVVSTNPSLPTSRP